MENVIKTERPDSIAIRSIILSHIITMKLEFRDISNKNLTLAYRTQVL